MALNPNVDPPVWPVQIELTKPLDEGNAPSRFDSEEEVLTVPMTATHLVADRTTLVLAGMNSMEADPQPALNHPIQPPVFNLGSLSTQTRYPGTTFDQLADQGAVTASLLQTPDVTKADLSLDAQALEEQLAANAQQAIPGSGMPRLPLTIEAARAARLQAEWRQSSRTDQYTASRIPGIDPRTMGI